MESGRGPGTKEFTHTFVYLRFDAEGVYIGTRVVTATITLSEDGSRYQGDVLAQNFDTSGNLMNTLRGTDVGQRLF